jgi:hypothetical protein
MDFETDFTNAVRTRPVAHHEFLCSMFRNAGQKGMSCLANGVQTFLFPHHVLNIIATGEYENAPVFRRFQATGQLPDPPPQLDDEERAKLHAETHALCRTPRAHAATSRAALNALGAPQDPLAGLTLEERRNAGLMGQMLKNYGGAQEPQKGNTMLNSPDTLTADESAVARAMGLTHGEFIANKQRAGKFKAQQLVHDEPLASIPTAPAGAVALTPEDREVASQLGLTEAEAIANKQRAENLRASWR